MKHIQRIVCFVVLTVVVLSCSGCGVFQQQDKVPINIAITNDIVSFDTAIAKDVISESVARCLFSTLYTFDENLNLVPCLADGAEQLTDREWVFKLHQNVQFHDGSPLTAEDVKYSLERAMGVSMPDGSLSIIDSITVLNDYTLQVVTKEPCCNLPSVFVRASTSVMSKTAMASADYDVNKPIGSGPFKLAEYVKDSSVSLERFDDYFLGPAQTCYLNFLVEPSEQERTADLLNGTVDVVFRLPAYDCNALKLNDNIAIYEHPSTKMELMMFNSLYEPLNNLKVRQAIAYAIDRQKLIDNVLDGYGSVLNGVLPVPLMGSIDSGDFAYNPELSKQLLSEAGYADGFEFTVLTFDMIRKKMMEYIRMDLAQVGIKLNYEFLELGDYLDAIANNQHRSSVMSWTSNADPDSTFSSLYSKNGAATVNQSRFSDKRVEDLIVRGREERDPQKRQQIYEEANQIVSDSFFFLPLYQPLMLVAAAQDIGGVCLNAQGLFGYENLYRIP